ncbi:K(+)-transporting ATPase subunit C [Microbacterium sp. zg.Y1090]|uniref:K(+)-transporting ATPase subunit C n=1 Tax=Microbacterium wangruii TaxID=3049073 RepID=UPI00214BAAD8|nr:MULTISPECIES: K(+)-transporting ATPase subunit C [unclassified Microbacterium]MCR2817425.1 K(+)-transporting ATPase subunit C [Microbacterium sp. zg.Y1090]MDL5485931.1 K(+)-transporting ATPase subunit C [Microbacterium sp. zg-Y1211]WIM29089.1 K(+)-transporting ATPase subunit C [Microbacterium sp. zg-Y1090]
MNTSTRSTARTVGVAVRAMALFTVLFGLGYTAVLTVVGQLALPAQANGSLLTDSEGAPVGSSLIGQGFTDADGVPLPHYFQSRPSAAGDGYDAGASSGSNLGPENDDLIAAIAERRDQVAAFNGVAPDDVPADAVTASSSGLDPHISPAYAEIQIERVAAERGIPVAELRALVGEHTDGPQLGYLGDATVNVLELNVALDQR